MIETIDRKTAERISEIFQNDESGAVQPDKKLEEKWGCTGLGYPTGGFRVKRGSKGYPFLICEWRETKVPQWWLICFESNSIHNYAVQISRVWKKDKNILEWPYRPSCQGGRNEERKEKFEKIYPEFVKIEKTKGGYMPGGHIPIPKKREESIEFFDRLVRLVDARIKANKLSTITEKDKNAAENRRLKRQLKDKEAALLANVSYTEKSKKKVLRHLTYERNAKLIRDAKKLHKAKGLEMRCEVCRLSFLEEYGKHGAGFIEGHHKVPFSKLSENTKLKPKDIALVCANCHRMIHHRHPWLTIKQLKKIWRDQNPQSGRR